MKRLYYILFCLLFFCQLRGQQATLIIIPEKENKEISYQFSDSEHLPFIHYFKRNRQNLMGSSISVYPYNNQ